MALKTFEGNESLDHYLTLYDRTLHPLMEDELLVAHFAK